MIHDIIKKSDWSKMGAICIGSHDLEKHIGSVYYQVKRELGEDNELTMVLKKLDDAFSDIGDILCSGGNKDRMEKCIDKMMKKYGHNIPSQIVVNPFLLFLEHGIEDKDLIGNKGSNLVKMHKQGITVPTTLIITSEMVKDILADKLVNKLTPSLLTFIRHLLYAFPQDLVAVRSSGAVSMAGILESVLEVDKNNEEALKEAILKVAKSWDSDQAKSFRKTCDIPEDIKLAILIEPMINAKNGYSGIAFSRDVNTGEKIVNGEYLKGNYADQIADGTITPKTFKDGIGIPNHICQDLQKYCAVLEKSNKCIMDIEFVYDGEKTYLVQARHAQVSNLAYIQSSFDFFKEGIIDRIDALTRIEKRIDRVAKSKGVEDYKIFSTTEKPLCKVRPCSSGMVTGQVCIDLKNMSKYESPIIVSEFIKTEEFDKIKSCAGLIIKTGGYTSHPAVLCRQFNKPCVVGIDGMVISGTQLSLDHHTLKEGDIITIIGDSGSVYYGKPKINIHNPVEQLLYELNNA